MMKKFHPFHMVQLSPWPIVASLSALLMTSSLVVSMNINSSSITILNLMITLVISFMWWKNVSQESFNQGEHYYQTIFNLKLGMILFITSEIMFFLSFFWAYFHSSISPSFEMGIMWPPLMINSFDPMNIPLLNSLILLSSGVSITWAHHQIINKNLNSANKAIILTIILGLYFTFLQLFEYSQSEFNITDASYGSTFFMATGFHGLHVIIGTTFIITSWKRLNNLLNTYNHTIGFETSAWYWHFVDVVWLFLYTSIYWWGY